MPPISPRGAPLSTPSRRAFLLALVLAGVAWIGALVGAAAVPLAIPERDPLSLLGIQILFWWVAAGFLLVQVIALVVAALRTGAAPGRLPAWGASP